jgi:hypothetical protein
MLKRDGFIVSIPIKNERGEVVGHVEAISLKGLLAIAHDEGLNAITTEVVQLPTEDNGRVAVVRAIAETRKGRFSGIGDANPTNVNRRIAPHILRMAESRAVARALRLAVNIGEVAVEELVEDFAADASGRSPTPPVEKTPTVASQSGPARRSNGNGGNGAGTSNSPTLDTGDRVTTKQVAAIHAACRRLGVEREDLHGLVSDRYGKLDIHGLSKTEASALLDHFNSVGASSHP